MDAITLRRLFGRRLKLLRMISNLTQQEMAERVGISVTHLSKMERGLAAPSFEVLEEICAVLETRPADLFLFAGPESNTKRSKEASGPHAVLGRMPTGFVSWMGSWTRNVASETDYWSDSFYQLLGYSKTSHQPSYELALEHVDPSDREGAASAFWKALAGAPVNDFRLHFTRADGEVRKAVVYAEPATDKSGQVTSIAAVILDVTDWVETEDSLMAGRTQLEAQLEQRTRKLQEVEDHLAKEIVRRTQAERELLLTSVCTGCSYSSDAQDGSARVRSMNRAFCGAIAHDLNNLFGAIIGRGEMLVEEIGSVQDHAAVILDATERAAGLIQHSQAMRKKKGGEEDVFANLSEHFSTRPEDSDRESLKGLNVLVIDDEEIIVEMLDTMLERFGITVNTALGGRQGISCFAEREGELDLVILDIDMPDVDGWEVYRAIRERSPQVPVLFSSGHEPESLMVNILSDEYAEFIAKPFRYTALAKKICVMVAN